MVCCSLQIRTNVRHCRCGLHVDRSRQLWRSPGEYCCDWHFAHYRWRNCAYSYIEAIQDQRTKAACDNTCCRSSFRIKKVQSEKPIQFICVWLSDYTRRYTGLSEFVLLCIDFEKAVRRNYPSRHLATPRDKVARALTLRYFVNSVALR
jgi:hypothetical protein